MLSYRSASGNIDPVSMFKVMWTESNGRVCGTAEVSVPSTDVLCSVMHSLSQTTLTIYNSVTMKINIILVIIILRNIIIGARVLWYWQNGLSFWYRPTQVVLEKRPLNSCMCVCVCVLMPFWFWHHLASLLSQVGWCHCIGYHWHCFALLVDVIWCI